MATRWWGSTLPASDARAPFGIRIASTGVCSNESGIDSSRIRMALRERVYASEARDGSADYNASGGSVKYSGRADKRASSQGDA